MKIFDEQKNNFVEKLNQYLDNELDSKEVYKLKTHPEFHSLLESEKHFRFFLKTNIPRRKVSSELIQSIKDKIRINPQAS